LDFLLNNGGTLMVAPTSEVDAETIDWAFRLNALGARFFGPGRWGTR
jgi:hypothetical protein